MKKLLKVTSLTSLVTLNKILMGLVVTKVIAIYAGPTGMAMLGQLQSLVTGLNGIVTSAVSTSVVKYTGENESFNERSKWWRASLLFSAFFCTIVIIFGVIFSASISKFIFKSEDYWWIITLLVFILPFSALGTFIISIINGLQQYKKYITINFFSVCISSTLMLMMTYKFGVTGALISAVTQAGLVGLVVISLNLKEQWFTHKLFFNTVSIKHIKDVGKYILMALFSALTLPLSLILIRDNLLDHVGWQKTGHWQSVWKISEIYLNVITIALSTYFLPILTKIKETDKIKNEVYKTIKILIPIICIISFGVYISKDLIIMLLFTEEFNDARNLFLIQLIGDVIKIFTWIYAYPLISLGKARFYIYIQCFFTLSIILLNYIFVPIYGVQGANIAYLVNYLLLAVFLILNSKKIFEIRVC